jgi:hypothetical protein
MAQRESVILTFIKASVTKQMIGRELHGIENGTGKLLDQYPCINWVK